MSPKSLSNYKKKLREDLAQKQIAYLASKRTFTQSATANPRQAQNSSTSTLVVVIEPPVVVEKKVMVKLALKINISNIFLDNLL